MMMLVLLTVLFGSCCICAIRAFLGPTAPDRVVAIDTLVTLMVASLVLLGVFYEAPIYLDVALVYAFLAFLGTLAISKYLEGRGIGD